jgi:predicted small integral membrane protein
MGIFGLKFGSDSTSQTSNNVQNFDQKQYNTNTNDSNNSTTIITDGGAILAMGQLAGQVVNNGVTQVQSAYDYADHIFDSATLFANNANRRASSAFDTAAKMTTDALTSARQSYVDATKATASAYSDASKAQATAQAATAAAYADAKGTTDSQKQIILGVLAVAAIMALSMIQRKAG